MIKPDQPFEISITQTPKGFKAISSAFPECTGRGKSEQNALKSLSKAIGKFVGQLVQDGVSDILLSRSYTDIMTDPIKNPHSKIRHYNKPNASLNNISLDHLLETNRGASYADLEEFEISELDLDLIAPSEVPPLNDGILFGFPINFN